MIFFFHPMPRFGIPVVYFCNVNEYTDCHDTRVGTGEIIIIIIYL